MGTQLACGLPIGRDVIGIGIALQLAIYPLDRIVETEFGRRELHAPEQAADFHACAERLRLDFFNEPRHRSGAEQLAECR